MVDNDYSRVIGETTCKDLWQYLTATGYTVGHTHLSKVGVMVRASMQPYKNDSFKIVVVSSDAPPTQWCSVELNRVPNAPGKWSVDDDSLTRLADWCKDVGLNDMAEQAQKLLAARGSHPLCVDFVASVCAALGCAKSNVTAVEQSMLGQDRFEHRCIVSLPGSSTRFYVKQLAHGVAGPVISWGVTAYIDGANETHLGAGVGYTLRESLTRVLVAARKRRDQYNDVVNTLKTYLDDA